jgi:hypothetical protein
MRLKDQFAGRSLRSDPRHFGLRIRDDQQGRGA